MVTVVDWNRSYGASMNGKEASFVWDYCDIGRLLGTIHEDWRWRMNYKEARQLCMRLLWTRKRLWGTIHEDWRWRMNCKEAIQLCMRLLWTRKRLWGTIHEDWRWRMNCKEARQLCMRLLWTRKRLWGTIHEEWRWRMCCKEATQLCMRLLWPWKVTGYDPWRLKMEDELQGGQTVMYEITVNSEEVMG